MLSAHRGSTACRVARTAAMRSTPMPTVTKIRRWLRMTERTVGAGGGARAAPTAFRAESGLRPGASSSGTRQLRAAAARLATPPTQYAPSSPRAPMARAAAKGPTKTPMRVTPPSVESARARKYGGTASVR
ncbi:hypothetical protein MN0502_26970 [Arthrobacter sp. MN05-02]|nr:hypothetical protein MN0502_26970 [Arthrobacter sp. MN05-02]